MALESELLDASTGSNIDDATAKDWTEKSQTGENHEVAGLLWGSVVLCCALSCSGVDLQRTSRERG
jgi:hypothetical protein